MDPKEGKEAKTVQGDKISASSLPESRVSEPQIAWAAHDIWPEVREVAHLADR
jgi:hypothetical protein